ncbi:MAG: hypothetical protein OJF50_004439 [Nitrospira sp.]|nr:hypothetical protein [Nitrospira sp.]
MTLSQRDTREHSENSRRITFYSLYLDKDESPPVELVR